MAQRRDALAAAAKLALEIRGIATKHPDAVCTMGSLKTYPGIVTAVVGRAEATLDQRDLNADVLAQMYREAQEASKRFAAEEHCTVEWSRIWNIEPIPFHPQLGVLRPQPGQLDAFIAAEPLNLTTADLVGIAKTQSQGHLLAISERSQIATAVSDVLLDRGDDAVVLSVAGNSGAKLSDNGFDLLLKAAESDDRLAETTGLRLDLPLSVLKQLLARASEAVRSRLLARTPAEFQEQMRQALSAATEAVHRESSKPRDFRRAKLSVALLRAEGELHEGTLCEFARSRKYEEMTVALSLLSSTSLEIIKPLLNSPIDDGLLIPCKVADCKWETVSAILATKLPPGSAPKMGHEILKSEFAKLSKTNAERLLRFWQVREASARCA